MTTFRSKVDTWLGALLGGAVILELGVVVFLLRLHVVGGWAIAGFLLASAALVLWVLLRTVYRLENDALAIRSGPFAMRIPLASITGIRPTRNPLSSPALSLDRLEISFGQGKSCMISPEDKTAFLAALRSRGVRAAEGKP